jgi:hypothetical protein
VLPAIMSLLFENSYIFTFMAAEVQIQQLLSAIQDHILNWTGNSGSNPEQVLLRINSFG